MDARPSCSVVLRRLSTCSEGAVRRGGDLDDSATSRSVETKEILPSGPYYVNENLERSDIRIDTADGSTVQGATLRTALISGAG